MARVEDLTFLAGEQSVGFGLAQEFEVDREVDVDVEAVGAKLLEGRRVGRRLVGVEVQEKAQGEAFVGGEADLFVGEVEVKLGPEEANICSGCSAGRPISSW